MYPFFSLIYQKYFQFYSFMFYHIHIGHFYVFVIIVQILSGITFFLYNFPISGFTCLKERLMEVTEANVFVPLVLPFHKLSMWKFEGAPLINSKNKGKISFSLAPSFPVCLMTLKVQGKCQSLSLVWLTVTPWTVACQAPLSMGCSRQEYRSGLPFHI